MPATLYEAVIPSYLQTLGAVKGLLGKAQAFCAETGSDESELIGARIHQDMLPFSYQVKSTAEHSAGAIEKLRVGLFTPSLAPPPTDFAGLHDKIDGAIAMLKGIDATEIDGMVGRDMAFAFGERRLEFTAENFLYSFSLPNFYFHAATAYDILRMKGVKIGKSDFIGMPRMKG